MPAGIGKPTRTRRKPDEDAAEAADGEPAQAATAQVAQSRVARRRPRQGLAARAPLARWDRPHQLQGGPEGRIVPGTSSARLRHDGACASAAAAGGRGDQLTSTRGRSPAASPRMAGPVFQLRLVDAARALELRERLAARLQEGETEADGERPPDKVCAAALVRHPAPPHFTGDRILLPVRARRHRGAAPTARRAGDPRRRQARWEIAAARRRRRPRAERQLRPADRGRRVCPNPACSGSSGSSPS